MAKGKMISKVNAKPNLSDSDLITSFAIVKKASFDWFDKEKMGDDGISSGTRRKLERNLDDLQSLLNKMLTFNDESLNFYMSSMQTSIDQVKIYFNETELMQLHQKTKNASVAQFQEKFGSDGLVTSFQRRYRLIVEEKLPLFQRQNELKRKTFIEKANAHNEQISREIKAIIEEGAMAEISQKHLDEYELNGLFLGMKDVALEMFDAQKMCDGNISKKNRDKLEEDLIKFRSTLTEHNKKSRFNYRYW
ncbi:uncharacterized protein LOC129573272 isoform X2 [Sitodiplosis mosellana]|uniref:uncharacterized protein LOC129573272 isoform X2 n=1 Tax=Sitodiplosis mosellana TaxID=263140 RepID=UPI0024438837|nr:uncharacterized protein LOC129573272 isoform X2 [Sitodiplosis mosellana]